MREAASGVTREAFTDREGRFDVAYVPPGRYDLHVEALGHRPKVVRDVPVRPGRSVSITVDLVPTSPPVETVDTIRFSVAAEPRLRPSVGRWIDSEELRSLPDRRRSFTRLGDLSTALDETLGAEGLPGRLSDLIVDGVRFSPVRHPAGSGDPLVGAVFPRGALSSAEILLNDVDVEWAGSPAAFLSGFSERAGSDAKLGVFGAWSGGGLWSSDELPETDLSPTSFWGGAAADVPLIRDTATVRIGIETERIQTPRPPLLSDTLAATLDPLIGVEDAESLGIPTMDELEVISAFARLDWLLGPGAELSVRANGASVSSTDGRIGSTWLSDGFLPTVEGTDISVGADLHASLTDRFSLEVRAGFSASSREYGSGAASGDPSSLPFTVLTETGRALGADPSLSADITRSGFLGTAALHFLYGAHHLKGGIEVDLPSYEYRHGFQRDGVYLFSDVEALQAGEGYFVRSTGSSPRSDFDVPVYGAFLQDSWRAAPGLEVILGARYDVETLPADEVVLNERWLELTGLSNEELEESVALIGSRLGFRWNVGERDRTFLWGGAGVFFGRTDPAVLNELLTLSGGVTVDRGADGLGSWPDVPPTTVAGQGPRLALLGPEFQAPRTARAGLGFTQALGERAALHLSGTFRRTEFLPRRSDLNLLPLPTGEDQDGRPVFGLLEQRGSLVFARPGSNRRFSGFDRVWARNADGWSEHRAGTVALEQRGALLDLYASYTYSETEDNLLGSRWGPEAQLHPFGDSLAVGGWSDEGTSDYDVPHRVVVSGTMSPPGVPGLRLGGVYRYRSGTPFTPGYRDGVDVNGDGSGWNDPAFVPSATDMPELAAEWDCLLEHAGSFAERNSCRGPGVHRLDLRLSYGLPVLQASRVELFVDALNVVTSERGVRDTALLLVDESGTLERDASGNVTLPVGVNPGFGTILMPLTDGRLFRLGLRVNY